MQNFTTALKAEHIKKKGTGIYILSIILGAVVPVILAIVKIVEDMPSRGGLPYNYYISFLESCYAAFVQFFFPLLIIITVSRITQLDHKNGGWQLMETQPVRKVAVYFSKFTVVLIANCIAIAALIVFSYLAGYLVSFIIDIPEHATTEFAIGELALIFIRLFLAGLFLTALQYVISVLLPSFIWSILIGFFLLLLYIFLNAFNVVPDWYPMELLGKVDKYEKGSDLGYWLTYSEAVSVVCSLIILFIGFEWYRHKKVKTAFFSSPRAFAVAAIIIIAFGGLLAYILSPNMMPDHTKTIVAGKIEGERKIQNLYVKGRFIEDTLAVIPVTDNTFHYELKGNIPLDNYVVVYDDLMNTTLVFAKNDSIYINTKMYKNNVEVKITGTRLAENQYNKEQNGWSSVSYYMQQNQFMDNPAFIIDQLVSDWKDAMSESNKFKTADNYIPKQDFQHKNKKFITLYYLGLWDDYLKKRAALFPDQKTVETAEIKEMKNMVPLNDESMLSNEGYFNYVRSQMIAGNDNDDLDENTKAISAIAALPDNSFKDKMLYWQLKKSLEEASAKSERDTLIARYADAFSNKSYTDIILNKSRVIQKLSKGQPAPLFGGTTIDNKPFNLAALKGKYVIIDVWATWCGPCKVQSPYFEKFALKYKKQNIQFVALSIDDKIQDWFVDAKSKSKSVLQVHTNDKKEFSKKYDAQSIPRFILIDPDGNLVNSAMPFPSAPIFEQVLRQELGLDEQK